MKISILKICYAYEIKTRFVRLVLFSQSNMNIARTAVGACSIDGMLYAVGGECALVDTQEDTLYLRCVECYDPVLRQWVPKPDMKVARSFVAVAGVGKYLYAIGN